MGNKIDPEYQKKRQRTRDEILLNRIKQKSGIPNEITFIQRDFVDSGLLGLMAFTIVDSNFPRLVEGSNLPKA